MEIMETQTLDIKTVGIEKMSEVPLFVVYDESTGKIFEQGFSLEAMEYYASQRQNCSVGMVMINEAELEVIEE